MRLIDADRIIFDYSGLVRIPPNDGYSIAKYFADQIKAMPSITTLPNDPLTLEQLREMDGEPVWVRVYNLPQGGHYCLCNKGLITFPSGRVINCEAVSDWTFYRRRPEEAAL